MERQGAGSVRSLAYGWLRRTQRLEESGNICVAVIGQQTARPAAARLKMIGLLETKMLQMSLGDVTRDSLSTDQVVLLPSEWARAGKHDKAFQDSAPKFHASVNISREQLQADPPTAGYVVRGS